MNETLKVTILAAVVALLVALGVTYARPSTVQVIKETIKELGAAVGPDRFNPVECVEGVCTHYYRARMTTATSTPCAFLSPGATTSLSYFSALISSSTSVTATTYTLATSTTAYATTSIISYFGTTASQQRFGGATTTILVGAQGTLSYASGASSSAEAILPPSTYVVLGVQGGTGNFGTAAQVGGVCTAELKSVY